MHRSRAVLVLAFLVFLVPGWWGSLTGAAQDSGRSSDFPEQVEQNALVEFTVEVSPADYSNPFDSAEIEVLGVFDPPDGKRLVIPGFWMQPFQNTCIRPACDGYALEPSGDSLWKVRFSPAEVGEWRFSLVIRTGGRETIWRAGVFDVSPSAMPGPIQIGPDQRHFQFASGEPFVPIGHNLLWSWAEGGGLNAYLDWLRQLKNSGGNYARILIDVPWFIGLEWKPPVGDYRAAQASAAALDVIVEESHRLGIALQVVLLWHQALSIYTGAPVVVPDTFARPDMSADWDNNPYSVVYGGPLTSPSQFFSNAVAVELFRRRLRYVAARWGYSPAIFAWEMIDRIDRTSAYNSEVAAGWLQDAASYLKQVDQRRHLVTVGSDGADSAIVANALLDFTTVRFYQRLPIESVGDQTTGVVAAIRNNLALNAVPVLLSAYSLNPWFEPTISDPDGIHFQDTLWAALFAGAAGGGVSDWWYTYVIPRDLQRFYGPLAAFVSAVSWPDLNLVAAEAALVSSDYGLYRPVRVDRFDRRFTAQPRGVQPHVITPDGVYPSLETVPSFLYGQVFNNQLSQAQLYEVTLPVDGTLELGVRRVSTEAGARLSVLVDNRPALSLALSAGSSRIVARVPLGAGHHSITLDNLGDDWLEIDYLEIGQLLAPARALTLRDEKAGVVAAWLQHRDYTWDAVANGVERVPLAVTFQIDRMPAGLYQVDIWDPVSGENVGTDGAIVRGDGLLNVNLIPFDTQLALLARRVSQQVPIPSVPIPASPEQSDATVTPSGTPRPSLPQPNRTPAAPFVIPLVTNTPSKER